MRAAGMVTAVGAVAMLAGGAAGCGASAPPATSRVPPPRFGQSVDIGLVSGKVLVTLPAGRSFTLGTQDRNVPIRSLIDTTHGRVDLRAASSAPTAVPADAQFYDGAFRIQQANTSQPTQIRLSGGQISVCSGSAGTSTAGATTAPQASATTPAQTLPHRELRLLHASGSGSFQTSGRYAAATVRGTIWLTEDFCDGTLVQVTRGTVSVEDLATHATVEITAGHSFFARAP